MATKVLRVSPDLDLPLDAVTQTFALLAVRRAGKSNAAAVMAEEFFAADQPWVAIDPKGDWWGLRANAAGDGPGLPVPIFGGLHGDMPLQPDAGRLMAELVVEHNLTSILDVSRFSKAARIRFLTAFAERLYELHQADPHPRHVFCEEADRMLPQRVTQDMAQCVGAYSDLIRLGGAFGLGATLISQRSAVINKDALTQVETMIAMRTTSPQDRKAIRDWMEHHAVAPEIVDSLPSLKSGEAWVSSSFFLAEHGHEPIQRIRFRQRATFDSGATPKVGQQRRVATLADIDLGALEGRMAEVVEKAAQDDPKALRRRIRDLERQLATAGHADPAEMRQLRDENARLARTLEDALARPPERVEVPVLTEANTTALRDAMAGLTQVASVIADALEPVSWPLYVPPEVAAKPAAARPPTRAASPRIPDAPHRPQLPDSEPGEPSADADAVKLRKGARNMLEVLARQHPVKITRRQLATLAKLKVTGGTFGTYFGDIKRAGLITEDGPFVTLTDAGFAYTGASPDLPITADELLATWRSALRAGARKMLDILVDRYPAPIGREALAAAVDLEVTGGTFGTYLGDLRRNGLADEDGDGIRAAEVFFTGGAQ